MLCGCQRELLCTQKLSIGKLFYLEIQFSVWRSTIETQINKLFNLYSNLLIYYIIIIIKGWQLIAK